MKEQATPIMKRVEHGTDFTTLTSASSQTGNFADAVFIDCHFASMNLMFADLSLSTFINCNFAEADLSFANAHKAKFTGSALDGVNLSHTNLSQSDLSASPFSATDIGLVDLRSARLPAGWYALDRQLPDGTVLSALLTPTTLQVNSQSAPVHVWESTIHEHTDTAYQSEVTSMLALCHTLGRLTAPTVSPVELGAAA